MTASLVIGIATGALAAFRCPWRLVWRLLVLVPMLEGLLFVIAYNLFLRPHIVVTGPGRDSFPPVALAWGAYFLVFHGPWIVSLGGCLWWIIRRSVARLSSRMVFVVAITAGGAIGLTYAAAAFSLTMLRDPAGHPPVLSVLICSALPRILTGIFAGFLVALFRDEADSSLLRHAS